jgi:hypothetical protein
MMGSRADNDLGTRGRSPQLALAVLAAAACQACSPSTSGEASARGDSGTDGHATTGRDAETEGGTDASDVADAKDAEAGYAVCPDGLDASFGSIYGAMLSTQAGSCGAVGFGCHSTLSAKTTGSRLDFSLDAAAVYAELLGDGGGFPATNVAGDAGGTVLRVVPGDAGASMLYIKLTLTKDDPRYGAGMPATAPGSICPPALQAVKAWIDTGAAR